MKGNLLSAKDLMNFCYCPRITYYEHVLRIPQATTAKEIKGREKYAEFRKKSKRSSKRLSRLVQDV